MRGESQACEGVAAGFVSRAERTCPVARDKTGILHTPMHRVVSAAVLPQRARWSDFALRELLATGGLDRRESDELIRTAVLLTPSAAAAFVESPLADDQEVERSAHGVVVSASVHDSHALRTFLLGFGAECEVLGPPELRAWMSEQAAGMTRAYAGG